MHDFQKTKAVLIGLMILSAVVIGVIAGCAIKKQREARIVRESKQKAAAKAFAAQRKGMQFRKKPHLLRYLPCHA